MKRLNFLTFGIAALFATAVMFDSCTEDPDPVTPTLQFVVEVDGYDVTITAESTDAETWLWDYGNGITSTTAGSHQYSYEDDGSGTYTITCTVTSKDDLTAVKTQNVTIATSIEEIIAGVGDEGKTWVLTRTETLFTGKMGGGGVTNDVAIYPNMSLVMDSMLASFGLGAEYMDEFTFYRDGTLAIDLENDRSLAGIGYAYATSPDDMIPSSEWGLLPLASIPGENMPDATWSLSYADRTVDWYDEFDTEELLQTIFTFPADDPNKIAEIVVSDGAYLGFLDLYYPEPYPAPVNNTLIILKEVTGEMMNLAIGLYSWGEYPHFPSLLLHMVLVPK